MEGTACDVTLKKGGEEEEEEDDAQLVFVGQSDETLLDGELFSSVNRKSSSAVAVHLLNSYVRKI